MKRSLLAKFSWFTLAYNLFVIVFGAFVRATGSGAGCGQHWPSCTGEIIPQAPAIETVIELTHRFTSGVGLILVVILLVWVRRRFPSGNPIRLGAGTATLLIFMEALLGAGLVLFEMVADNVSVARGWWVSLHLTNTLLLVAALALTAYWLSGGQPPALRNAGRKRWVLGIALLGGVLLGMSGAIAALGDTLFPVTTFAEGLQQDASTSAHIFLRLRIWHPIIAILTGAYIIVFAGVTIPRGGPKRVRRLGTSLIVLVVVQLAGGALNLALLAPVWMQLVHLFFADLVWINLILYGSEFLLPQTEVGPVPQKGGVAPSGAS